MNWLKKQIFNLPCSVASNKEDLFILTLIVLTSISFSLIWTYVSCIFVLAIILVIGGGLVSFKRPEWFLYFIATSRISLDAIKLFYYNALDVGMHYSLSLDGIITALFLFCALKYFTKKRDLKFNLPGVKAYIFFLLICFISLSISLDKIVGIRYIIHYLEYFFIYIFGVNALDSRQKNYKMIIAVLISALIPLTIGFYQAITLRGDFSTLGFNRIYATTPHPNAYAFYLMVMLIFSFTLYLYSSSLRKKISLFFFAIAILLSLILTYTRGAWFGAFLGLTILLLSTFKRNDAFLSLVIIILLIVMSGFFFPRIPYRLFELTDSWRWRMRVWMINFEKFLRRPLIGYGIGSSNIIGKQKTGYVVSPHNDYLRLMVEMGLLGFCAFLAVVFSLLRFYLWHYRHSLEYRKRVFALGLIVVILSSLFMQFGDNLHHYDMVFTYFWFFVVIGYTLITES
ncbi:MAG: O-antigen ligase family protein [Candidatus Omnitrophica bacterium]|nr:O-antigen ligase family protein [Candidatus Omnitrophota bacterium]